MSSSPHSRSLAITCVGAITIALGSMYYAGKNSKRNEGPDSVYRSTEDTPSNVQGGKSDAHYKSSEVRGVMHDFPGKR
ncbi:hypothetical protein SERLADRAFT_458026 [Serpula lacrymans var. lacrymans S7.9]|uniref:Uncharacterized protein n=1 Tax=Serpula lacrymans var. lacrymans (strain S7.9) TaxID=578457 RepID=F8NIL3_SERL9|nr:uncharacterized protein SERLADRAFT_458026 [Serpula lacrymans var. lacrymans S7.9]EGO29775.1 hypothetical protein SERLADRAFT_458026 [Serpula lacrymans var. lacrymans S7.9]